MSLTDADDSIVLSDLVRSGEASRLRRRGALVIRDHQNSSLQPSMSTTHIVRPPMSPTAGRQPLFAVPAPAYPVEFDEEDEEETYEDGAWGFGTGTAASIDILERDARRLDLEAEMRIDEGDQTAGYFAIYCNGADLDSHHSHDHSSAPTPSASRPRRKPSAFSKPAPNAPRTPRRTGCGALVHVSAMPRRKCGVWIARGDAGPSVAPLDRAYFSTRVVDKIMESSCGCIRTGIGCRVCGNALGTIFTPCQAAAAGLFSTTTSPSPSPGPPEAPLRVVSPTSPTASYWLPRAQTVSPPSNPPPPVSVYTFFSDAVHSEPEFAFPPAPPPPTPLSVPPPIMPARRRWTGLSVQVDVRTGSSVWAEPGQDPDGEEDADEDPDGDGGAGRRSPITVVGGVTNPDLDPDAAEKVETSTNPFDWAER
ncbi:unnamed protein product [Peniophora sp. CBMAI 1063]|nr:unnamed protein product [Peniophora sp. CBMAI 1063]